MYESRQIVTSLLSSSFSCSFSFWYFPCNLYFGRSIPALTAVISLVRLLSVSSPIALRVDWAWRVSIAHVNARTRWKAACIRLVRLVLRVGDGTGTSGLLQPTRWIATAQRWRTLSIVVLLLGGCSLVPWRQTTAQSTIIQWCYIDAIVGTLDVLWGASTNSVSLRLILSWPVSCVPIFVVLVADVDTVADTITAILAPITVKVFHTCRVLSAHDCRANVSEIRSSFWTASASSSWANASWRIDRW